MRDELEIRELSAGGFDLWVFLRQWPPRFLSTLLSQDGGLEWLARRSFRWQFVLRDGDSVVFVPPPFLPERGEGGAERRERLLEFCGEAIGGAEEAQARLGERERLPYLGICLRQQRRFRGVESGLYVEGVRPDPSGESPMSGPIYEGCTADRFRIATDRMVGSLRETRDAACCLGDRLGARFWKAWVARRRVRQGGRVFPGPWE